MKTATKIDTAALDQFDLQYISTDTMPGITRTKRGKGFSFICPDGKTITDKNERERLLNIAVPPSYTSVWYCPLKNGHIQATGHDMNAKKQYFYHSQWEILREISKFSSMTSFGQSLPSFRHIIRQELSQSDDYKSQTIAAMIRLLDKTGIRIGSDQASDINQTYGLTTLRKKHVTHCNDDLLELEFKGKGGVLLDIDLTDRSVIDIIQNCVEIPGQRLFEYIDDEGQKHHIDSHDVNQFIKTHMGERFSAKDFRTWRFSCLFLDKALKDHQMSDPHQITLKSILDSVSEESGNTPSILQKSYIHPGLILCVKNNEWDYFKQDLPRKHNLLKIEQCLLHYLQTDHAKQSLEK